MEKRRKQSKKPTYNGPDLDAVKTFVREIYGGTRRGVEYQQVPELGLSTVDDDAATSEWTAFMVRTRKGNAPTPLFYLPCVGTACPSPPFTLDTTYYYPALSAPPPQFRPWFVEVSADLDSAGGINTVLQDFNMDIDMSSEPYEKYPVAPSSHPEFSK